MVKVTSSPSGTSGADGSHSGADDSSSGRRTEDRDDRPDPAALSSAASQASFHLQRLEKNIPPEDNPANNPSLRPIGTLNVGDRYASVEINSPQTALAATKGVSPTDHLDLTVPGQTRVPISHPQPPPTSTPTGSVPAAFSSTSSGYLSFPLEVPADDGGGEDEEERRRRMIPLMGMLSASPPVHGSPPAAGPSGLRPVGDSPASPSTQRYCFEVRDVNWMGGTPSMMSIRDRSSGELVGRYELPVGNSRLTVDLPPGNYTVEAQSGSRSVGGGGSGGGDQYDNFRVEAYAAGPTPSGSGGGSDSSSGGGGGAGGGGGGGTGGSGTP